MSSGRGGARPPENMLLEWGCLAGGPKQGREADLGQVGPIERSAGLGLWGLRGVLCQETLADLVRLLSESLEAVSRDLLAHCEQEASPSLLDAVFFLHGHKL